jgi:hypothetical protein
LGGDPRFTPGGNLLLTTLPHELPIHPDEAAQLDEWISRGNTLVVAAALDDTPAWALAGGARLVKDVGRLTRLRFDVADEPAETKDGDEGRPDALRSALNRLSEPRDIVMTPRGVHPLMRDVHSLRVVSDFPASHNTADRRYRRPQRRCLGQTAGEGPDRHAGGCRPVQQSGNWQG